MGGCSVYRHKKRFFCLYYDYDGYHDGLGVKVISSVPKDPEAYRIWLEQRREEYDHPDLKPNRKSLPTHEEYIYEIDLDNEIFWMDGYPMFRLDCMPSREVFLEAVEKDWFGHYTTNPSMPIEHKYVEIPPPPCDDRALAVYESFLVPGFLDSTKTPFDSLLGFDGEVTKADLVRTQVFGMVAWQLAQNNTFASLLIASQVERIPRLPHFAKEAAVKFALFALIPMFRCLGEVQLDFSVDSVYETQDSEIFWANPNLCIKAASNLDDELTLRASIGMLVEHIRGLSKEGRIYAVLSSVFHCVVVKIDMDNGGTFTHTPALDFLPPRHPTHVWTLGTEVVMKLAAKLNYLSFGLILGDVAEQSQPPATHQTYFDKLPEELIRYIASFLFSYRDPRDLASFGSINYATRVVVGSILNDPVFGYIRVLPRMEDQVDPTSGEPLDYNQFLSIYYHMSYHEEAKAMLTFTSRLGLDQRASLHLFNLQGLSFDIGIDLKHYEYVTLARRAR